MVPSQMLQVAAPGAVVDLFVRPEDMHPAAAGEPITISGMVATQIYQGGHVDLYVDVAQAPSGRVLLRVLGQLGISSWPPGTRIGIALAADKAIAFPALDHNA